MTRIKRTKRAKRTRRAKKTCTKNKKTKKAESGGGMFEVSRVCKSLDTLIDTLIVENYHDASGLITENAYKENIKKIITENESSLLEKLKIKDYDAIINCLKKKSDTITKHKGWENIENKLKTKKKAVVDLLNLVNRYEKDTSSDQSNLNERNDMYTMADVSETYYKKLFILQKKLMNATEDFEKLNAIFQKKIYYDVIIELLEEKINQKKEEESSDGVRDSEDEEEHAK